MKVAFTLAEVLITLAIIGVVAAMTIPNLIASYEKKVTVVKLRKIHASLNQLVRLARIDGGVTSVYGTEVSEEKSKELFETYWLPYFKSPVLAEDNTYPYSIEKPFHYLDGSIYNIRVLSSFKEARAFLNIADGSSLFITYYFWKKTYDENNVLTDTLCYESHYVVYVDLNGTLAPNTFGKDLFVFVVDFASGKVYPLGSDLAENLIEEDCSENQLGMYCAAKIQKDGWIIMDDYPW